MATKFKIVIHPNLLIAGLLLVCGQIEAQPANDAICNATSLTINANNCTSGTNIGATTVASDKIGSCWIGGTKSHTIWYSFNAPASGNVTISTDHSGGTLTNSQLSIYSSSDNTCSGTLTEVSCAEDGGDACTACAVLTLTGLVPAKKYFVELDGYSTNTGTLCIDAHDGNNILTNDNCANAMNIWVGSSCNLEYQCTFTSYPNSVNTEGTGEAWETAPACWTQGTELKTVWFKFAAMNTTTNLKIESVSGGTDPHVAIYSGTCGSFSLEACQEDKGGGGAAAKGVDISFTTIIGQTYYIQYDNEVGVGCNRMCVSSASGSAIPTNDVCANAKNLVLNTPVNGKNWLATIDGGFSCGTTENTVWYKFTAASSGTYFFTILNQNECFLLNNSASTHTNFYQASLQMALYNTASCTPTSASELGCTSSLNTSNVELSSFLTAGNTYLLAVDGIGGSSCKFTIEATPASLLPVSVTYFDGHKNGLVNIIEWGTMSEINNDYFVIEHSSNGLEFAEIGRVNGVPNSNEYRNYSFTDQKPEAAVNYYRLMQIDMDGTATYPTHVITINNPLSKNNELLVFPNPVSTANFKVVYARNTGSALSISIKDMMGQEVYSKTGDALSDSENAINIDLNKKLDSGIYLVTVNNEDYAVNSMLIAR